jgi:CubicO group peptidase (beta-lactamase class C family)
MLAPTTGDEGRGGMDLKRCWTMSLMMTVIAAPGCAGQDPDPLVQDPELRERLAPLVERAVARELAPGLQVAVVMRDGRAWTGAFGVADLDTGRPVTDDTRFYIASTTKALTALAAARLAERGELDLDATLAEAFPAGTRFHADYDPSSVTVRDLLTHTHGIQQGPISYRVAFTGQHTNELLLNLLERHPPLPDREFQYSNFGYDLTGFLLAPETDRGWKDVVEREVLTPLGMTTTTAYRSRIADSLIASPHDIGPAGMARIRLAKGDQNLGPAGGHFSTATDLARLLLAELDGGRLAGRQVIPGSVVNETQRVQVPQEREFMHYRRHAWGLGWDIGTVEGDTVLHRPGSFSGYYANAAFLPEHGFGVVVLSNGGQAGAFLAEAVAAAIYGELRGRDGVIEQLDNALDGLAGMARGRAGQLAQRMASLDLLDAPPRPLEAYAGTYVDESWGTVEVAATDDGLELRSGMVAGPLTPLAGESDAFFAQLFDPDDQVTFEFVGGEAARSLAIRGTDVAYVRRE